MPLALLDVCVQVVERFHVNGSKSGDLGETRDFGWGQANVVAEANHFRRCQHAVVLTIFAPFHPLVFISSHYFKKYLRRFR